MQAGDKTHFMRSIMIKKIFQEPCGQTAVLNLGADSTAQLPPPVRCRKMLPEIENPPANGLTTNVKHLHDLIDAKARCSALSQRHDDQYHTAPVHTPTPEPA